MRTHANKRSQPEPSAMPDPSRLTRRAIGNRASPVSPHPIAREAAPHLDAPAPPALDFSTIPLHPKAPPRLRATLAVSMPGDVYEREADEVAERVTGAPGPQPGRDSFSPRRADGHAFDGSLQAKHVRADDAGEVAAPPSAHEVLGSPGRPLDPATRAFMEPRFGHDFGRVRVHTDERASESAREVDALAYTVGRDIVFRGGNYAPGTPRGDKLLAHELTHVIQQGASRPALMRQTAGTPAVEPRTYIFLYGSGQLNPTTSSHHQGSLEGGGNFYLAAKTKRDAVVAGLGADASKHNIVFGYTPTEAEVKTFLNVKYAAPVEEIHIFSHGWPGGTNLGGPNPTGARPASETPGEKEQRWLEKEDMAEFDINFAPSAKIVLYGCNIGNAADAAGNVPFAQEVSDAFGVPVTASTTSSHFERKGGGTQQVPDKPGKMQTYTPQADAIKGEVQELIKAVVEFTEAKRGREGPRQEANSVWNKVIGTAATYQAIAEIYNTRIAALRPLIKSQRVVAERFIRSLPEPEKTKYTELLPKLDVLVAYFDQLYPD